MNCVRAINSLITQETRAPWLLLLPLPSLSAPPWVYSGKRQDVVAQVLVHQDGPSLARLGLPMCWFFHAGREGGLAWPLC